MFNLFIIGKYPNQCDEKLIGGAVKIVKDTFDYFESSSEIFVHRIDLNSIFKSIYRILLQKRGVYLLNVSQGGFIYGLPLFYILSRIHRSKLCLRLIGGDHSDIHRKMPLYVKKMHGYLLQRCDVIFCEVEENRNYFREYGSCLLIPNSRVKSQVRKNIVDTRVKRRIVFVSQVRKEKGVQLYINADPILSRLNITLDLYGPICDEVLLEGIDECSQIKYRGVLDFGEVHDVLMGYDFVILLSSHIGEGYPGIVIESFNAGVPVLVNDWRFLGEMLVDGYNGYMMEESLENLDVIYDKLTDKLLGELSNNSRLSFERYDQAVIYNRLNQKIQNVWYSN